MTAPYPMMLNLQGRRCLVVGGGVVAARKVNDLRRCGAEVRVVAPVVTAALRRLADRGVIAWAERAYRARDLDGAFVAIAATDDPAVNRRVSEQAQRRGILVNVVDDPAWCTFIVPATVRRGDILIAISTSGRSPALAKRLRQQIEETVGPEYGRLADLLGRLRAPMKALLPNAAQRRRACEALLDSDLLDLLRRGKMREAEKIARACLSSQAE
jgi:siroheme synthase-like protein